MNTCILLRLIFTLHIINISHCFFTSPNHPHSSNPAPIRLRQNQILKRKTSSLRKYRIVSTSAQVNMSDVSSSSNDVTKSLIAKIGSTTSSVVAGTFFLVLAYQRDSFMMTFFIGSILNGVASKILKKVLNVQRPEGYEGTGIKPSDGGMPSSHAMSLGFIGTYCVIQTISKLGLGLQSGAVSIGLVAYAAVSLIYRVQCKLHTRDQIIVGLIFGISNSFLWHSLAFGQNPYLPNISIMEFVSANILPSSGIMPIQYLAIPALVGAAVVGSFERRISLWLKNRKSKEE